MKITDHTDGPWTSSYDGTRVSAKHLPQGQNTIARVSDKNKKADVVKANSLLIAAAPDLVEVANNAAQVFSNLMRSAETEGDSANWKWHLDYTLAAIEKTRVKS